VIDHLCSDHDPMVVEYNHTVPRIFGRIELESQRGGVVMTDFSLKRRCRTDAVTGLLNQLGEIQPFGEVIQKVEGWFETCKQYGFNGKQGVLIPESDDGLEVLTGIPTDQIHQKAKTRLLSLAEIGVRYSFKD